MFCLVGSVSRAIRLAIVELGMEVEEGGGLARSSFGACWAILELAGWGGIVKLCIKMEEVTEEVALLPGEEEVLIYKVVVRVLGPEYETVILVLFMLLAA